MLKTNFKNYVWSGPKRFRIVPISGDQNNIIDVTPYTQVGDDLDATMLNEICEQINQNSDDIETLTPLFDSSSITIGEVLIQFGSLTITPSLGSNPYYQSVKVTFPESFKTTPFVITAGGNGYSDVKNTASYNATETGFTAFMSSTGQTGRLVKWFAIGKR